MSEEAEAFLASLGDRGRSGHTLAAYRRDLAAYERFLAGRGVSVTAAAEGDVDAYLEELAASGRRPASVTRALVAVRALHRSVGSEAAAGVGG
ncbi:MAG: site-specific integrase, partial [Actinomycetota bacterium]|nr:site-specific integrase [Actinomycetota bacterium]